MFITTKGAGSTQPGQPYLTKFPDKVGIVCTSEVARPEINSNYFNRSNGVDLHNHARQAELAFEKNRSHRTYFSVIYYTIGNNC